MSNGLDVSESRARVAELYEKGLSVREVASLVGISTQRVYQHLQALELPPPTRTEAHQ